MAHTNPGKFARTLKSMLTTALIVAASVGATLFFSSKASQVSSLLESTLSEPEPVELPKPIFSSLEPFTVTLRNDHGTRILYVAITLRLENETSRRLVAEFMPEVRDRILRTLAEQNAGHIQTVRGRSELVALLHQAVEQPYAPQPVGPSVNSVLFTAFVIQ